MSKTALTLARGASRIQARSFLRPSTRNARDVMALSARGRHENGSNGSQQSNKSSGHGQRHKSRLPLRSTAVAGFSILAALSNSDNTKSRPDYAFKHPSGWDYMDANREAYHDWAKRYNRAKDTNSIEAARSAHFDLTRTILEFCVHGELIDEGTLPSDVVCSPGRYVKKEDTKVFWMPSPDQGGSSLLCLSVHCDLVDKEMSLLFLDSILEAGMCARLLEKFKEESGPKVFVNVHYPLGFFVVGARRDDLVGILERSESLSAID